MTGTDKTTLADAEEQAEHAYERAEQPSDDLPVVTELPTPPPTQKTAGAELDDWFAASIQNSEYSRDTASYNAIQKAFRALRGLIS